MSFAIFDKFGFDDDKQKRVAETASLDERVVQDRAIKYFVKNEQLHFASAKHLNDLCIRPKAGEQWRIVTEKAFNAYAFILSLLQEGDIDDLHVAIYRINEATVRSLIDLIDNCRIRRASFIISSFFNQTKKPEKWAQLLATYCIDNPRTSFAYLHNHAKVVCAKCGGDYYVFEGSGNMSDNARIEQYTYENNKITYDFHCEWIDRLILQQKEKENEKKIQIGRN